MQVATVGIDLAKNIFHVHCVDQAVHVIFSKPLRRAQMGEFFVKMGSDHDFRSAHPGSRDAQIRQVDINLAQRDMSTQAFQREHVARRGQALVLPAAISGTLI